MMMNLKNVEPIYPDKFTLSLDQNNWINMSLEKRSGVLTIEQFVNKKQENLKLELFEDEFNSFLDQFVRRKLLQGYKMTEALKPHEELIQNFGESFENKKPQMEEEKLEDFIGSEEFECPIDINPVIYDALRKQIRGLDLQFQILDNTKIKVTGKDSTLTQFSQWFSEFICDMLMGAVESPIIQVEKTTEKIAYSILYENELENIIQYATMLEVECILLDNYFNVTGCTDDLKAFKAFLSGVGEQDKKYLFPKYWDFSIVDTYSEITVDPSSEEFKEICELFNNGFDNGQVSKLTRIQNNTLFRNYIDTIYSRTVVGPDLLKNRKMLFHGTRMNKPSSIFKHSDIGFDMEKANSTSKYGKGLYFAASASYSHQYTHTTGFGTYQMLLADVYIGVSHYKRPGASFRVLAADQDSLHTHENVFVLFQNSQSYPLYLIDYTLKYMPGPGQSRLSYRLDPNLGGPAMQLSRIPNTALTPDALCLKRIQKEFDEICQDKWISDNFFVEKVEKAGCIEWNVSLIGFLDTPYEGGLFKMKIIFPADYPIKPPYVQFLTRIYHPSINSQGIVCLGVLSHWTPTSEIRHILLAISCILHDPLMEDALMPDIRGMLDKNRSEFAKVARSWTTQFAV